MWAETRDIYRRSKKPVDDFWTEWVSRPPAAWVVWLLGDSRVTPNQLTLIAFAVGVASAAAFVFWRGWLGLAVAGVLFQLSYVLDCADGQLARLRGTASELGHELDFLTDELKAYLIWSAVSARLWIERGDLVYLSMGMGGLAVLASNLSLTKFMRHPTFPAPPSREEGRSPHGGPVAIVAWVGKWLVQYPRYLLIVCLVGRVEIFFYAYLVAQVLMLGRSSLRVLRIVVWGRAS